MQQEDRQDGKANSGGGMEFCLFYNIVVIISCEENLRIRVFYLFYQYLYFYKKISPLGKVDNS